MNTEKQLQEILETLKKIEGNLNPPIWKQLLNWMFAHLFEILIFILLCYLSWKTYEVYLSIQAQGIEIIEGISALKESTKNTFENFKFWK